MEGRTNPLSLRWLKVSAINVLGLCCLLCWRNPRGESRGWRHRTKEGEGTGAGGGERRSRCWLHGVLPGRAQPRCPLGGERATVISSSAESSGAGGSLLHSSSLFVLPPTSSPPVAPLFLSYPEAAFCLWLESMKA